MIDRARFKKAGLPAAGALMPEKPNLLVLASTYPRWRDDPEPGFVHELCRRLTDRFNVTALVPSAPDTVPCEVIDGVRVVRYRYAPRKLQTLVQNGGILGNLRRHRWKYLLIPGFLVGQYIAARHLFRTQHFDVIHAHWLVPQGLISRLLGPRRHIPYMVTSHGGDLYGLKGKLLTKLKRWVAEGSCAMTVVSSAMKAEASCAGVVAPSISVVPMGVDLFGRFVPDADTRRDTDHLLFVGRLVAKKGLKHLLQAMPLVVKARPNAMLSIVGFGPEEACLRAQAHQLGIEDKVRFLGARPQHELPSWYRRASVFVAPFIRDASGDQEGLPVVMMEAIACGCPTVVGDVAGIDDMLGDGDVNAIKVAPSDEVALAQAITAVLQSPIESERRSIRLRTRISELLDWSVITDAYGDLLTGCLQDSNPDREPSCHEQTTQADSP